MTHTMLLVSASQRFSGCCRTGLRRVCVPVIVCKAGGLADAPAAQVASGGVGGVSLVAVMLPAKQGLVGRGRGNGDAAVCASKLSAVAITVVTVGLL
jgi:hypothetical protein